MIGTIKDFSVLGDLIQKSRLDEAIALAKQGQYVDSANKFSQCSVSLGQQVSNSDDLAYAFYRRALLRQSMQNIWEAIEDLERAREFPGLHRPLRLLIQERLTALQKPKQEDIRIFDQAIIKQFGRNSSDIDLQAEFFCRFGLRQAHHMPKIVGIDEISAIGVYRWMGDTNRNEQWSQLIRKFKQGDNALTAFFARILAEHMRATPPCIAWLSEIDYIVPVPAAAVRTADRGMDILAETGQHLGQRLAIPLRPDFLNRVANPERSRFVSRTALELQYSFDQKKAPTIQGRTILLLDDVMNRGYTASVCTSLLKKFGCSKVVLLVLAQAESALKSDRYLQMTQTEFGQE